MTGRLSFIESTPQTRLPTSWYFDPDIYKLEVEHLFANGHGYMGHELMVPHQGDYQSLEWLDHGKSLVHGPNGPTLLSNICRHRQAIILKDRGHIDHIICPLHRWKYNLSGKLQNAPQADSCPDLALECKPLQNWHGFLFSGQRDIAKDLTDLKVAHHFKFEDYVFDRTIITKYNFNWKIFIEVYLEDYHVMPFHPGLRQFVDCNHVEWQFGDHYSVQIVAAKNHLKKPGSPVYAKWHDVLMRYRHGQEPEFGAIWLTYYPGFMIELYPNVMVASQIIPTGINSCMNVVEFYYPKDVIEFGHEFMEAEQAAYNETAVEDEDICQRMFDGRKYLNSQGKDEFGPYLDVYEVGIPHFLSYIQQKIKPHLK